MMEKLVVLKLVFKEGGDVMVGNFFGLNDGVVVLILMSECWVLVEGKEIFGYWQVGILVGVKLELMGIGFLVVIKKLFVQVDMMFDQFDLIEINEVFVV